MRVNLLFLYSWFIVISINGNAFVVDANFSILFQSSGNISINEWAEFKGDMPHLNELTLCHWNKLDYFSDDVSSIWSYCTQETSQQHSKMMCIQMEYKAILSRANRHMKLILWIYNDAISVDIVPFPHRQWNHICWTYSSVKNRHKIYVNGKQKHPKIQHPHSSRSNTTVWKASDSVENHAFVIGQEPDRIRGGYTPDQLFKGSIKDLNIWNTVLDKTKISEMAHCKSGTYIGNVKSWALENLKVNEALVVKGEDDSTTCQKKKMLIIFPRRQHFYVAKNLCQLHGGKLHTPQSPKENSEAMQIIHKHKEQCMDTDTTDSRNLGKSVWLGLKREKSNWIDATNNAYLGASLNYSNWAIPNYGSHVEWAYLQSDGFWKYAKEKDGIELCTICSIDQTPVFTMKGNCKEGLSYYNYYIKLDDKNQIDYYETYKTALDTENIQVRNGAWNSIGNRYNLEMVSGNKTEYPIGRLQWNIVDRNCALNERKYLSFSRCEFGDQYTCASGHCISIEKRCNNVMDCEDNSDEIDCLTIEIPNSYRKVEPPRAHDSSPHQYSPIETKIIIRGIDEIDTLEMTMELTIDINMVWTDGRLTYTNLLENTKNLVGPNIADKLWIPLDYVVHEHGVTGKIKTEKYSRVLSVQKLTKELEPNLFDEQENRQFSGHENKLEVTQRFRITYKCTFQLMQFPFDRQCCEFMMYLQLKPNMTLQFQNKEKEGVVYQGSKIVDQFHVVKIGSVTGLDHEKTWFTYNIHINRHYMHQLISTLFPCCLLWLLSYFSLFINMLNFNNRFMGSVTILLVLVSLRGSIANDLPKTSYFKYIDLWFVWYISNIFLIITYHIIVDNFSPKTTIKKETKPVKSEEMKLNQSEPNLRNTEENVSDHFTKRYRMNKYAIVLFPIFTCTFNLIYFSLTIS